MRPKGMEDLVAFSVRQVKRAAAAEKEKSIPLQKDSESQSTGKVIPASFLKIEEKRTLVGAKDRRERDE